MIYATESKPNRKWLVFTLIAGCAACCALPIFSVLGFSGVVASVAAAFAGSEVWFCVGITLTLGIATLIYLIRRRTKTLNSSRSCSTTCDLDQSCCNSASNLPIEKSVDQCSLSTEQLGERTKDFRKLFASFVRVERHNDTVNWYFNKGVDVEHESRRLAELEAACCSSLRFDIGIDDQYIIWAITGNELTHGLIDLFYQLPTRIQTDDGIREFERLISASRSC